jgi:SNF2 family DNA or RNA helicase
LSPYQRAGTRWLHLLSGLGLGACLADDMGLGKTIQVLALLLVDKARDPGRPASLLVAPASLLGNRAAEIEKFAPGLKAAIVHPSAMSADEIKQFTPECHDLAITSYGSLLRIPAFAEAKWRFVILDEAQAIKNPNARQTKAAKALRGSARIALTGTPVENSLGDLWSIFDFINPGLLGSAKQFSRYAKGLAERTDNPYGPLRELVRPYILRRMKTDRSIIADLPDKTEIKAYCGLSRRQAAMYEQAVEDLEKSLEESEGIQRKGVVLAMLTRLKQICNHPSQWLNDSAWAEDDSGKSARLREIAEVVAARQEKMLVFTQFREMTGPLAAFLGQVFGRSGLVLHGETAVKNRKALVQRFQDDESVPFFVLSLKAGGSGLTLTAASHVIHVDRWWNPAVENQATDRAFRIGQKKNVVVHKFICRGTVEEKIDRLMMCKHVAATLYGIGSRLDTKSELLFLLRSVSEKDLVADIGTALPMSKQGPAAGKVLETGDMAALFGLDMGGEDAPEAAGGDTVKAAPLAHRPPEGSGQSAGKVAAKKTARTASPKPAARAKPAASRTVTAREAAALTEAVPPKVRQRAGRKSRTAVVAAVHKPATATEAAKPVIAGKAAAPRTTAQTQPRADQEPVQWWVEGLNGRRPKAASGNRRSASPA